MFRNTTTAILLGLGFMTSMASAQPQFRRSYYPPTRSYYPPQVQYQQYPQVQHNHGYYVQFRQPYWREQRFNTQWELDQFVQSQQRNGWEVQVMPDGCVRYRLLTWGGSRVVGTLGEANAWSAQLEQQGYEVRVIDNPN